MSKKIVRITENELVDLIEGIVNETVNHKKTEWLAENEKSKTTLLENKVANLETLVTKLTSKK
jgi:hypothetical protein